MNKESFDLAFGHSKPKQISKPQSLFIKGKIFTHPVNAIQELNENIIGIDFIHALI
jgi:hypothetical protein